MSEPNDLGGGYAQDNLDLSLSARPAVERLEEAVHAARLVQRLATEAVFLKAQRLELTAAPESLRAALIVGGKEAKSWDLKPGWFGPIVNWLSLRVSQLHEHSVARPDEFFCAFREHENILEFRCQRTRLPGKAQTLVLSEAAVRSVSDYMRGSGCSDDLQFRLRPLLDAERGFLVVAAPNPVQLLRAGALVLSTAQAHFLSEPSLDDLVSLKNRRDLIVFGAIAGDGIEALLSHAAQVRELGDEFLGVVCLGAAKRVCEGCAKSAVLSAEARALLPKELASETFQRYREGQGCDACHGTGVKGQLILSSVVPLRPATRDLIWRNAKAREIAASVHPLGTHALAEEGCVYLRAGKLSVKALLEVSKNIPAWYEGLLSTGSPAAANASPVRDPSPSGPRPRAGASKPILLIVEDDPDQRSILEMVFRSADYDIVTAGDGLEALEQLAQVTPDLIVTDLMMPRMDGREFVRSLRSDPRWKSIPVMVLTVVSDGDKEYDLLDVGADDYCDKTVQRKVLLKRIENLLTRKRR